MKKMALHAHAWILVVIVAALPAFGQDAERRGEGRQRRNRAARRNQADGDRARSRRRGGGRARGLNLEQIRDELQTLGLSPAQKDQIDELLAKYQADIRDARAAQRERLEARRDELRALREKARAAREAGDREAARAVQKQLREIMGGGRDGARREALLGEIRAVLNDEQKPAFRQIVARLSRQSRGPQALDQMMPQMLLRVARAAKLDPAKLSKVEEIAEAFAAARGQVDRSDRGALRKLVERFRGDVKALVETLSAEEKEALQKAASRGRGGRPREGRAGQRGERRQRRRRENPDAP